MIQDTIMPIYLGMEAYKNEIFGPVLCVLSADTLEEAIELVNRL